MASLEDLFYQIFNRKNWIIDQLKQQQHLYDQSLASNLLINQICPPSWLWNNNANPLELKKEELISDLLFLPRKTTVTSSVGCYPLCDRLLVKGDNRQLSDSFFTETCASSRYFHPENRLPEVPKSPVSENVVGQRFSIKEVAARDSLDASHQVQDPEKVEDGFVLDHSLARIQRSKSRQKAIELRNSEKLKRKNHPSKVSVTNEYTGRITRSRTAFHKSSCLREQPKSLEYGEGNGVPSEAHLTNEHGGKIAGSISMPQKPSYVDESLEMVKSSNQREGKCPREAAGLLAMETVSSAPKEDKYFDGGLNPNLIDPCPRLSVEMNCRPSNSYSVIQKSELQASGRKTSKRIELDPPEPDVYKNFEPKQLVFDDIEECDELKPTQSSVKEDIEDCQSKDDGSEGKPSLEKEERNVESVVKELLKDDKGIEIFYNEALEGSVRKVQVKEGLDLVEIEKVSSSLSHNGTAEIWKEALVNTSPVNKEMSNHNLAYIDSSGGLQGVDIETDTGNKILEAAVSILEEDVNSKMNNASHHDLGSTLCESCVEVNIVRGDSHPALDSVASGTHLNFASTNPANDTVFPCTEKLDTLLEGQVTGVPKSSRDAGDRSVLKEILTPEAAQICSAEEATYFLRNCSTGCNENVGFSNDDAAKIVLKNKITPVAEQICSATEEAPYFLRNHSTGHDKDVDSAKSTWCQHIENSSQLDKVPPKASEICSEGRKAPYNLRSHSTAHDKNADSISVSSKNISNARETSWPPFKRRKIDNQLNLAFESLLRIRRVKPVLQINDDNICACTSNPKVVSEPTEEPYNFAPVEVGDQQLNVVVEHPEVEMDPSMEHRNKGGSRLSPKLQLLCSSLSAKEDNCDPKSKDHTGMTQGPFKQVCLESSIGFGLKDQVGGSTEESADVLKMARWSTSEIGPDLQYFTSKIELENVFVPLDETEDDAEGSTAEMKSQDGEKYSYYTIKSPNYEVLNCGHRNFSVLNSNETMPEFEGFSIGVSTKTTEPFPVGNGLIFENSDLPGITETWASAHEQCRSSIPTPLPYSSTNYRINTTPYVYQSLPNGFLEHIGLRNSLSLNADGCKKLLASKSLNLTDVYCNSGAEINDSLLGSIEPGSISSSSSVQFGLDIKRPANYTPPIGKYFERRILKSTSSSSEKQLSRIPELTCFRIEEDTSTDEENGNLDEKLETPQKGISSKGKRISTNPDALADVTSLYSNPPISISETGKFLERSVNSVNAEKNLVGTQVGSNLKIENLHGNSRKYTTEDKENQNFCPVGPEKAEDSFHRRVLTPKLSSNAVKRNGSWNSVEKGGKPNNILSNISSFLPFVQQKPQAPAILTGKRDIKVKALEAAEAAKRLEEKKENERKIRKEAAKIERAKIEAENLRQLEMKQKQKVEERKKKEAELAAKKRQREEEEKEKERKRKCIEETRRQQQKEHGDKLRAEKEEKERKRKALEEKERKKKVLTEEAKKQHKTEKARGAGCRKMMEMGTANPIASIGNSVKESSAHENSEAFEKPDGIDKVSNNFNSLGMASGKAISIMGVSEESQSYEITPYKGSDDEEEDDDLTPKKFLPPWARKENLVPDLLLQQQINPDEMFLRSKCFSLNEVLGTWKQRPGERKI